MNIGCFSNYLRKLSVRDSVKRKQKCGTIGERFTGNRWSIVASKWDSIYVVKYYMRCLQDDTDRARRKRLFSQDREREEAISGGDDTRRITGTSHGRVGDERIRFGRAFL